MQYDPQTEEPPFFTRPFLSFNIEVNHNVSDQTHKEIVEKTYTLIQVILVSVPDSIKMCLWPFHL